ncbi:MAG: hypothetical protein WB586_19090 [Chthoniobacterales bacterium]
MFVDSNFGPRLRSQCRRTVWTSVAAALTLCSCNNDKVEVYRIPKEGINVAMQGGTGSLVPTPATDRPVHWTKPEGWKSQALSEMRIESFKVDGPNASSADVSITAFPGEAGGLSSNLNRWRGQLQLPPLSNEQLSNTVQRIEVDKVPTLLVDFQTADNNPKPARILGAVLQKGDRTWFVKMTGPPILLESQRQIFFDFVRSFHFTSATETDQTIPPGVTRSKSTNDE